MPRGKTRPVNTVISELEMKKAGYQSKIENYKTKISELDKEIQNLLNRQKQKELEQLLDIIKASGKTPEEVIAALT